MAADNYKKTDILMVRLCYTIPNSFTAMSLLLGVGSIVTSQLGDLELAAWMIIWCGLLDVLDGLAARLLKATSDFGAEFDSMADLVSFGVAPGMLILQAGIRFSGFELFSGAFWVLAVSVGVFVLCGAMRLARFNIMTEHPVHGWFTGIPITAAGGGLLSSAVILMIRYPEIAHAMPLHAYLPVAMFVLALGMVSTIRFPKAVKRDGYFINGFTAFTIITTYYCGITRSYPEYLFFMGLFILVAGIIAGRISIIREREG
ncbi:MAG: CDP-diacylglycerol--serine O-phosphatidyltransferase [Proteobacteria bacterium]|nr:CDP-diacylglycerol--serine O-phosphatidyltransferase [Pseudomonadota bacterium]